jgi:hypothetical protein
MLAVFWSTASHFVMGVPFDMITKAARNGGEADEDLKDLIRINANRFTYIADVAGVWLVAFAFFLLSALVTMGFAFGLEFCQALFLIFFPMALVFALTVRLARRIKDDDLEASTKRLKRHRITVQVIGMFSILLTSLWGMYFNLTVGVLGS